MIGLLNWLDCYLFMILLLLNCKCILDVLVNANLIDDRLVCSRLVVQSEKL